MAKLVYNEDVVQYVKYMKSRMVWYGEWETHTVLDRCMKFYAEIKWFLYTVLFIAVSTLLYFADNYGLYDGTFVCGPQALMMSVVTSIAHSSGQKQQIITMALNGYFNLHDEPWMNDIKRKYLSPLRKFLKGFNRYNNFILFIYLVIPPTLDCVLHYGFDALEAPIAMPGPLSPILGTNFTWGLKHHAVQVLNTYIIIEQVYVLQWFIVSYSLLTVYFLIELVIFKEKVKGLNFDDKLIDVDEQFQTIVDWHNNIIRLNKDLKEYLGLSCAFQSFFTSITLTLVLFTCYTSSDPSIIVSYTMGLFMFLAAAFLYCWLGQILETESIEVFRELYNLPWYRVAPSIRKNLNMMMRQAREPLTTDYHGRYKMNLANFMQILRSSYQYFTLLQSVTSKQ